MSEKLTAHHLARRAIVYVRQSSHQQVVHNRESQRRQYAMEQRVRDLGWHETEVIDEDQGRSATSTHGRTGFQRMVAEVCLGRVGAVAAIEVSRFARNNRDWHQLIEMCGMVETLLIDNDTIYDPRRANDRLLLGLKGSMSEYELDLLRQRSLEARWAKARRGELVIEAARRFCQDRGSASGEGPRPAGATRHRTGLRQVLRAGECAPGGAVVCRARRRSAGQASRRDGLGNLVAAAGLPHRDRDPEGTDVRRHLRLRAHVRSGARRRRGSPQERGTQTAT